MGDNCNKCHSDFFHVTFFSPNPQIVLYISVFTYLIFLKRTRLISIVSKPITLKLWLLLLLLLFLSKKIRSKKLLIQIYPSVGSKKFWSQNRIKSQKVLVKKIKVKRIHAKKNFRSKQIWGPTNFESNKF